MSQLQEILQYPTSVQSMRQQQGLLQAILFTGLAVLTLFGHFILSANFGLAGYIWLIGITVASLTVSLEFVCVILVLCLFLQNAFIGLVVPAIHDPGGFSLLQGTSFIVALITSVFGAGMWIKLKRALPKDNRLLVSRLAFFFMVTLIYTVAGAISATPMDALIYARVYLIGGLMLITGVVFGLQISLGYFVNLIRLMAFFLVVWAIAEFYFTYEVYHTFNVLDFYNLKFFSMFDSDGFNSVAELIDYRNSSYFNLSGAFGLDIRLLRLSGPSIHPITYAYMLVFCALVCFIYRMSLLSVGCFIAALMIGAKGPLLMLIFPVLLYYYYSLTRNRGILLTALWATMALYFIFGLIYGFSTKDYHVIGFMGGVNGFFSNPFGHGIGVGGNLSRLAVEQTDFGLFQGHGASFALESAFGVMLYQIGIGIIAFVVFYGFLWKAVWKATQFFSAEPRLIVLPCALGYLFVNCVFQEEALSPSGWGLWLLFSGFLLAKYWRLQIAQRDEPSAPIHYTA